MTPEQLTARWLEDVDRIYPWSKDQPMLLEEDALAAIARLFAPGDDLVAQAQEYAAMMRQDWDDWHSDEVADCKASTADVLDEAAARLSALTAQVGEWQDLALEQMNRATLYSQEAEAAEAEASRLRDRLARMEGALTLAANRLQRRAVDYIPGGRLFIETSEWAAEARAALTDGGSNDRTPV